jgi:site-specific recombinase XerD
MLKKLYVMNNSFSQELAKKRYRYNRNLRYRKAFAFHLSRHTFATLTMSKCVSLESVSKMLGQNIQTTQIYAKMTTEKVGRDMAVFVESIRETERKFVVNL